MKENVNVNELNEEHESAISYAIRCKKPFYVRELLENGGDPSLGDANKTMPLIFAIQNQDIDSIKLLLQYHAPTSSYSFEQSPLYNAMLTRNLDIVYLLLFYGACPITDPESQYSYLYEAIRLESPEIFKALLVCGASQPKITSDTLSSPYKEIYDSVYVSPDNTHISSVDIEKHITTLVDDFTQLSTKITSVCGKVQTHNLKEFPLTPIINNQNAMIATFTRIVKRIDSASKLLFAKRIQIISSQIGSLASEERALMEGPFKEDEKAWQQLITETAPNMTTGNSLFDGETKVQVDELLSIFQKRVNEVFKATKVTDEAVLKASRGQLAFQNTMLVKLNKIVISALNTFDILKKATNYNLETGLTNLAEFQQVLAAIRQTTVDIPLPESETRAERESKTDEFCAQQEAKIQLDSAYLLWLQSQFHEYSDIAEQCLRMCLQ